MKVYGDADRKVELHDLISDLNERIARTNLTAFEEVRSLLIAAGEVEQAVADAVDDLGMELVAECERVTDSAAAIFCGLFFGKPADALLSRVSCDLPQGSSPLTVKTPEGFVFYALYPEQYVLSAKRMVENFRKSKSADPKAKISAVVIGIRSIGTTLSAVVNATMRSNGWNSERVTVRTQGHPFDRTVVLPKIAMADCAVVVDEGPGLSGSSMAAAARALEEKGFVAEQIVFLPAHENGPGEKASPKVTRYWNSVQLITRDLHSTTWNGKSLPEGLIEESCDLMNGSGASRAGEWYDCSGGLWRRFAFNDEAEWPAVGAQFERMKFLCRTDHGVVLWKFIGLEPDAAERTVTQMRVRAEKSNSPAPLRTCNGFVATPWIEGQRLSPADVSSASVKFLADYIASSEQEPLSRQEAATALWRLKEMLIVNCTEELGHSLDRLTERFIHHLPPDYRCATYGDGRMAPHEWVRTNECMIFKTDGVGHDCDHTLVGSQSVYWDMAGAIVEWEMGDSATEQFLANCVRAGLPVREEQLLFYQMAYAAFRLGYCRLNQTLTGDESETNRFRAASERYGMLLRRLMRTSFSKSVTTLIEPGLISTRDIMSRETPRK